MIVRCGRCRAELEIAAPGEFICPACGTRNAVRGAPAGGMPPSGAGPAPGPAGSFGGLTVPGGGTIPPPSPSGPEPSVNWATCPSCAWRFAHGETETLTCPSCRASLIATEDGLRVKA